MTTQKYWEAEAKKRILHSVKNGLFLDYWTKRYTDNLKYITNGRRILDIGCGDAKYFIKLTDKFEEFYGVEFSKVHFDIAREIFSKANYVVADGNELPFKDSSFDTIISFGAFEHNDDIDLIFKQCYRILNKNGFLMFSVPNYVSPYFPYMYLYNCIINKHNRISSLGHHYSNHQLKSKLKNAGFQKVKFADSIYAVPIPIPELVSGFINIIYKKYVIGQTAMEIGMEERHRKLKSSYHLYKNLFDKLFYPLERLGFGFMRVIYCEK